MAKILLIEDDGEVCEIVKEAMKEYDFDTCNDLIEAEAFLSSSSYNLILSDINLPDGDSLTLLTRYVVSMEKVPPILLMTGSNDRELVKKAIKIGVDGFIDKPFTLTEIKVAIKKALVLDKPDFSSKFRRTVKASI